MNRNPSPKFEFAKDSNLVSQHQKVIELEGVALKAALAEYHQRLTHEQTPDLGSCASAHLRAKGAEEFVDLFLNLAETPTPTAHIDNTNLAGNIRAAIKK